MCPPGNPMGQEMYRRALLEGIAGGVLLSVALVLAIFAF